MSKPAATASAAIHILAMLLLLSVTFHAARTLRMPRRDHVITLLPPRFTKSGGGGQRQPLPASRGHAPEPIHHRLWIPPTLARNEAPKLILNQALFEAPELNIESRVIGDPLSQSGIMSGGLGGPGGFGNGGPGGIGDGPGPRQGGLAPQKPLVKLTRPPQLIYKEDPEYSEEARKARFEGTVILELDVDSAGRPTNVRVTRSLGLGLDEKAIAAVEHWRFRPAIAGTHPVQAPAQVEVTFRLL